MRRQNISTFVILAFLAFSRLPSAVAASATKPAGGDAGKPRIVCFGDSITAKGYPEVLAKSLGQEVVNAGVGGNTTAMALKRLEKDVLDRKPGVVVILFGTNDSRVAEPKVCVPVEKYEANLKEMIDKCQSAGAKVIVCTPPPIDPVPYFKRHPKDPYDKAGGLEKILDDYRAAARRAAESKKAAVVDLATLLAKEDWMAADGVHPTEKGTTIIAGLVADGVKASIAPVPRN
jgi:lysophospholipase L1-like esterase